MHSDKSLTLSHSDLCLRYAVGDVNVRSHITTAADFNLNILHPYIIENVCTKFQVYNACISKLAFII